jgi:hypothetical protein
MSEPEFRPGLADVPVAESAISFIDGKRARLEYRGIAVEALARESTFEETSWLLLKGALPTQRELALFDRDLKQNRSLKYRQIDILKCLPPSGHPMEALQASLAALGMFFPAKEDTWESILHLVAKTTTLVAAFHRVRHGEEALAPREDLGHAANFFYMLTGGAHPLGRGVERGRRGPFAQIDGRFIEHAPGHHDAAVGGQYLFFGMVLDRPHALLQRVILRGNARHTAVQTPLFLGLAIDQVVVV